MTSGFFCCLVEFNLLWGTGLFSVNVAAETPLQPHEEPFQKFVMFDYES